MKPFTSKHSIAAGSPLHVGGSYKESALLQTQEGEKNYIVRTHPKTGETYKIDKRSDIYKNFYKDNAGQGTEHASLEKQVKTDAKTGKTESRWQ